MPIQRGDFVRPNNPSVGLPRGSVGCVVCTAGALKLEEARKALAAKLHADRCLAEAGLELIAEVSRLNNGGSEQIADASIAQHIDQLQPLAKSYGYRIVKPSMLAQVVKL